ncbi:MAG TPA: TIR domain-containing protein [Chroococcidiopsis sp.]
MATFQDVFISYGRADSKTFATKLHDHLRATGLEVWFDQEDIPLGVDYQKQIDEGIEKAHNFVYIIAPHSVNSPYCLKEIELAIRHNKRIIPLLHVEHISYETWQQRNPNGTAHDWETYQAKGLHSSFPNMHPTIGKINWIYFREGIDDFERSLAGLLDLVARQQDYVTQHTALLANAITWQNQHKDARYLLVGEERLAAERWLKTRFDQEQAPCEPTDLHCEFICKSIQNANNLTTRVFLSHSDQDRAVTDTIAKLLMRESITVWVSTMDIKTGAAFQEEINRGIEEADNLVYLISPSSLASEYCQQEMAHALALNKRIVPLLIAPVEVHDLPDYLRSLQFIDLTENIAAGDRLDISKLLHILTTDATYHEQHKLWLSKALKWERQNRNSSILLRGYNRNQAETWLSMAQRRSDYRPTALQVAFIEESLKQPPDLTLDVFVSYSRTDSDFARRLNDALQLQGKTTWFDQESIAAGVDFQQEIYRGIETSDNFLFVLSPSSVGSPYCAEEVEHALKLNKRIVTVLHRGVDPATLHPGLASVQWIDFNRGDRDFYAQFNELVRTLDTDREHVREHTKWSLRSLEWRDKGKNADLLLRGSEFILAENWLQTAQTHHKHPAVTDLQEEFLKASERAIAAAKRQAQIRSWILRGALVAVSGALVMAIAQWRRAEVVQEGQINALSRYSAALFGSDQAFDALLEGIRAGRQLQRQIGRVHPETQQRVVAALLQAFYGLQEQNRLIGHQDWVSSAQFSPDGQLIVSGGGDGTLRLWKPDGELLQTIQGDPTLVTSVSVSPDGELILTSGSDGTVKLWSVAGKLLHTLSGHQARVNSASFSPDGQQIASASNDKTIRLWSRSGELLHTLSGHQDAVLSVSFSPDGQTLASGSLDKTVKLWDLSEPRAPQVKQTLTGQSAWINSVSFSPDGQLLASASGDSTINLWTPSGELLHTLTGHHGEVRSVSFSPDSQWIATASWDKTVRLWDRSGQPLAVLPGHQDWVNSVSFSPDGRSLVSASSDKTVKLWLRPTQLLHVLNGHQDWVTSVSYSPQGNLLATASRDNTIKLWNSEGQLVQTLNGHGAAVTSVTISPDGEAIATTSSDGTVKLWDQSGKLLQSLSAPSQTAAANTPPVEVVDVSFSPDGTTLATSYDDGIVKLWNRSGALLKTLAAHTARITSVAFSPDGQLLATASRDNTAKLWDRSGTLLHTLAQHQDWVNDISFSPDGKTIATVGGDRAVFLWDRSGKLLQTLAGHESAVNTVSFSPDGKMLITASGDETVSSENVIKLWNRSGQLLQTLTGHQGLITSVTVSPGGQTLASAGADQRVMIWQLSVDRFGTERIRDLSLEDLLQRSCAWVKPYLQFSPSVEQSDRTLCRGIETVP